MPLSLPLPEWLTALLGSPWPWPLLQAGALLLAWALDRRFGEPPDRWHPVAWLGRLLGPVGRFWRDRAPAAAFAGGALSWLLIAAALAGAAWALQRWIVTLPGPLALGLLALALKPLFACRMLCDEVAAVEAALAQSLEAGRARLAWLVSRDVTRLDAGEVRLFGQRCGADAGDHVIGANFDDLVQPGGIK